MVMRALFAEILPVGLLSQSNSCKKSLKSSRVSDLTVLPILLSTCCAESVVFGAKRIGNISPRILASRTFLLSNFKP
jgi:hypothetical protein